MKTLRKNRRKSSETGVALLIALITLLLISGVAVAMIVASGSEGKLNGNYRSSSSSYYAAMAGIEEARGRLLPTNPNTISNAVYTAVDLNLQNYMAVGQAYYIYNGSGSVAAALAAYPDTQYASEFGVAPLATPGTTSLSGTNASNIPGPMFRWVRVTPVTERSLGNVDVNGDGTVNSTIPLYYDGSATPPAMVVPPFVGLVPQPSSSQNEVLEVTALAVLPDGTQKLLQYLVAPQTFNLNFPSALTLAGSVGVFQGASSNPYQVDGQDGSGSAPAVPGCSAPNPPQYKDAIGVSSATDATTVTGGIPANRLSHYTGGTGTTPTTTPDVKPVSLNSTLSSPASMDQLIADIRSNADAVVAPAAGGTYNFGGTGWPSGMSASNPKTIYVDGDFDLGPNTGYGLLVVTGNFHYHGNSGWNGVILVIGDGTTTFDGQGGGNGEFDGAIFVATTRDAAGNQLANFGTVNYDISGGGGNGVYYDSCWIRNVQKPPTYKVLSFREIAYSSN